VWRVAVASPVSRLFDYLPPADGANAAPGCRLRVPFGRGSRLGVLVATAERSELDAHRLKRVSEVLDPAPALPAELLRLLGWCAEYYHHPPGEVICGALPALLRQTAGGNRRAGAPRWRLTATGRDADPAGLARAARQRALLQALRAHEDGLDAAALQEHCGGDWRRAARALQERGWLEVAQTVAEIPATTPARFHHGPTLNQEQHAAAAAIGAAQGFEIFLLDGITGSGKTEVYFSVMETLIRAGGQILLLVPEIGLTPQLVARVGARFDCPLAVLHSGLAEGERLSAWQAAADGVAPIIIGTRSAVFTPAPRLAAIVVDEEHDGSYKQQESLRYHARDVAIMRARNLGIPIVLGSATPALESVHNAAQSRYRRLTLTRRAGKAAAPSIRLVDLRADRGRQSISGTLADAIAAHLAREQQVLLFLNRRGYAPTLLCEDCGWVASCPRCDARMIVHRASHLLRCHHCETQAVVPSACPECGGSDLRPLGQGTERLEETLRERFPDAGILRIDRDSTRRRGALDALMENMRGGKRQILLGTQMLAKGHDLPNVTLVGILDADQGLFGADFRAGERMGQLITQVAGRAGRADKKGEVLIQTRHPEHPLLGALLAGGYGAFAANLLEERRQSGLPPYRNMAIVRAESVHREAPVAFLSALRERAGGSGQEVEMLGPAPAPMERRAGRYRAQLMLLGERRGALHALLATLVRECERQAGAAKVRWSLDIDPIDEY
jgi:primosomal protein N' (replication factor Y)